MRLQGRVKLAAWVNTFLETFHRPWFEQHMPVCLRDPGGSIWIERRD